jgi:hypothetical protein
MPKSDVIGIAICLRLSTVVVVVVILLECMSLCLGRCRFILVILILYSIW